MSHDSVADREPASSASRGVVAAVLLVGLVVTAVGVIAALQVERGAFERRFDALAEQTIDAIDRRMRAQEAALTQLRNTVLLQHPMARPEFDALVTLGLQDDLYPGAQAIEFARRVAPGDLEAFVTQVRDDRSLRADGYPDFEVFPTPLGVDAVVVDYVVPHETNEAVFGFNLAGDEVRRSAVVAARDRGDVVGTAPIRLIQGGETTPGFLLFQAVYDTGEVPLTAPARRRHFVGLVAIVFAVPELLEDVVAARPDLALEVYDVGLTVDPAGAGVAAGAALFDVDGRAAGPQVLGTDAVHHTEDLDVGDRRWRLVLTPNEALGGPGIALTLVVALGGLAISGLLGLTVLATARARDRAVDLAEEMTEDLRAAEQRLRSLVDGAPDATLVVDGDGRILQASDQVEVLLGYAPSRLVGGRVDAVLPHGVGVGGAADHAGDHQPVAVHADGGLIAVEVSLSPVPAIDGGTDVMASLRDVSVQREARAALERALETEREAVRELERTDQMRTTFLGTVSHELQTPLTAITGFADLLTQFWPDMPDEERRELLVRIRRNAGSLSTMIQELLDFTRLERGTVELRLGSVDLRDLVERTVAQLAPVFASHEVIVTAEGGVAAEADPDALERVLTNLLTNATRYAPHGTRIDVRVLDRADGPQLVVDDQGPGIPAEKRESVFETFYRGDGAAELAHAGTGLGLAVVRELVQRMGGQVEVSESASGGARLVVSLQPGQPAT